MPTKLPWGSAPRIHKCRQGRREMECQKLETIAWGCHRQSAGYLLGASIPRCLSYRGILSWIRTKTQDTAPTTIKGAMERGRTSHPHPISTSGRHSRQIRPQTRWPLQSTSSSTCPRENLCKSQPESKSRCFLHRKTQISYHRCWQEQQLGTRTTLAKGSSIYLTKDIRSHICWRLTMEEEDSIISNKWLQTSKTPSTTTTSKLIPLRWARHIQGLPR